MQFKVLAPPKGNIFKLTLGFEEKFIQNAIRLHSYLLYDQDL